MTTVGILGNPSLLALSLSVSVDVLLLLQPSWTAALWETMNKKDPEAIRDYGSKETWRKLLTVVLSC